MTRFVLVRHGQTEWNRHEHFRGRIDIPLNETGRAQAAATARRIATTWQPAAVYTGPLSRAYETAVFIARAVGLIPEIHPGLNDIDYGRWHGLTPAEVRREWPEAMAAWLQTPHRAQPPEGETLAAVQARAMAAVHELAGRHPQDTVVLVGHTVVNRVILLGVLGLGLERFWRLGQDTCALNVFTLEDGEFTLLTLNDTCHLGTGNG
jgi:broad specificity phosphatase PhoE